MTRSLTYSIYTTLSDEVRVMGIPLKQFKALSIISAALFIALFSRFYIAVLFFFVAAIFLRRYQKGKQSDHMESRIRFHMQGRDFVCKKDSGGRVPI